MGARAFSRSVIPTRGAFPLASCRKGGTYASVRLDIVEIRTRLSEQFPSTAIISSVPGQGRSKEGNGEKKGTTGSVRSAVHKAEDGSLAGYGQV